MPRISAIICTHNRSHLLRKALQSLLDQTLDQDEYEIIVVDNASTDDTREVVAQFCRLYPHIRYVYQPIQGIAPTRNRGFQEASAEIVAYLDDDEVAEPNWLEMLLAPFDQIQPRPACVGGKIFLSWETSRPEWLILKLQKYLGLFDHGDEPCFVSHDILVTSANAYLRTVLVELGGFNTRLGHVGTCLLSGEEAEFAKRLEETDYRLYYQPRARVHHLVHTSRLNKPFFFRRSYWQGYTVSVRKHLEHGSGMWFSAGQIGQGLFWLLVRLGGFVGLYPVSSAGERVKRFCMVCANWGRIQHELAHLRRACTCWPRQARDSQ